MKQEKDIVEFFNHYSAQMLPTDGEQFMQQFKQNIDLLPVPSAFDESESELSKEYTRWMLEKMKKDYKCSTRDTIISGVLISMIITTTLLVVSVLGLFDVNFVVRLGVFFAIGVVAIGFVYATTPIQTRIF